MHALNQHPTERGRRHLPVGRQHPLLIKGMLDRAALRRFGIHLGDGERIRRAGDHRQRQHERHKPGKQPHQPALPPQLLFLPLLVQPFLYLHIRDPSFPGDILTKPTFIPLALPP